jgi:hypothetical protein
MLTDTYKCTKCKEVKLKTDFHRCSRSKHGVVSQCKVCRKIESAEKYPSRKEYFRQYARENRVRINERSRNYGRKNRAKRRLIDQEWEAKHPLDKKRDMLNGKAKKFGLKERTTLAQLEALWEAQGGICPYTLMPLSPRTAVADHIVHPVNGGSNTISNIVFVTRQVSRHKLRLSPQTFSERAGLDFEVVSQRIEAIHCRYKNAWQANP